MDYLVFASAGGVEAYFDAFGSVPEQTIPVCIGPVADGALKRYTGDMSCLMAEEISADGIVSAILRDQMSRRI